MRKSLKLQIPYHLRCCCIQNKKSGMVVVTFTGFDSKPLKLKIMKAPIIKDKLKPNILKQKRRNLKCLKHNKKLTARSGSRLKLAYFLRPKSSKWCTVTARGKTQCKSFNRYRVKIIRCLKKNRMELKKKRKLESDIKLEKWIYGLQYVYYVVLSISLIILDHFNNFNQFCSDLANIVN